MRSLSIELPDAIYEEAVQAACERGLSVEKFVADYMRLGLSQGEADAPLTPAQWQTIREAEAAIDAGQGLTPPQVKERLAAKRASWTSGDRT